MGNSLCCESLLLRMIITHFVLHGLDATAKNVLHTYRRIKHLCHCCTSIEFPPLNHTIGNVESYLSKLYSTIELLKLLFTLPISFLCFAVTYHSCRSNHNFTSFHRSMYS